MQNPYDDDEGFEYFVIPADHHEVAKAYMEMLTAIQVELKEAHDAHNTLMREKIARFKEAQRVLWTKLCTATGVDAEKSWDKPNWHIEGNYLSEGFVALTTHKLPEHPLAAMLKQPDDDDDKEKAEEGVPEGTTVN